jgi:hypothetical protein
MDKRADCMDCCRLDMSDIAVATNVEVPTIT